MARAGLFTAMWQVPEGGAERVLFDAAWENEKLINYFRVAFCFVMGVPSAITATQLLHSWAGAAPLLVWGTCAVGFIFVLRRSYRPAVSFLFSTADATVFVAGLYFAGRTTSSIDPALSQSMMAGVTTNVMFVIGVNAARFSAALAVWTAVYATCLRLALLWHDHALDPGLIFETILFAAFAALLVMTARRLRQVIVRVKERDAFARFLPAPAVERFAKDPSQLVLTGEAQDATILFSDIRGFTALSSTVPPATVVAMLNEYFAEMVDEVFKWGGTLDKFIGDGLVAVFAPPSSSEQQAQKAIGCALGMRRRLRMLNERRRARGEEPLEIGIGLHSGLVVAGSIGTSSRMEYTHIGDAMNTCSRIEGLTKELGAPVLASEVTVQRAGRGGPYDARELPEVSVKGKTEKLKVYAVTESEATKTEAPAGQVA